MAIRERTWTHNGIEKSAWQVDYIDQSGKRLRKQFDRKKDADAFLLTARTEVRNGVHVADSASITVAVAAQQWLDMGDRQFGWERATAIAYAQHVRLHIVPLIGGTRLSQFNAAALAAWEDALFADGRSPVMVRKVRTSLGAILTEAQRRGQVHQNVVKVIAAAPRSTRQDDEGKAEVGKNCPTPAEVRSLLPQLQGRFRPLILTALFTGLRTSELRGLTWAAVDLKAGELTVSQRLDRFGALGRPKSKAGKRTLPLLNLVVNALRELKVAAAPGQEFVFVNSQGNPEHRNTIIGAWHAAQVAAFGAVKYPGLHAARHFFASWCINRKADGGRELPLKVVQGLLGHASIQMTADVYGHLFPRSDDTAELEAAETAFLAG